MKKIGLLFGAAAFVVLAFVFCYHKNTLDSTPLAAESPEKYPVTSPIVVDTTYNTEYVAEIQSLQNVEIRTRIKGYIQAIHTDEGQAVKQGQLLFTLNNQEYKQDIAKAQAELRQAQAEARALELEIQNTRQLVDKNIVAKTELDMAEARLDVLKAKIEEAQTDEATARLNLSYTEIRAPFDGIVSRIPNKVGSLVDEGALLTTLSDNEAVYAYFNVPEHDYLDFVQQKTKRQAEDVALVLANGEPYGCKGRIETIDGQFDKGTGNIAMRARFPNPGRLLRHGASGKISLPNPVRNAMIIPQKSVFDIQDKTCVYVVDESGNVQLRSIVPKLRLPQLYVVDSGLSVTDKIIYEGIQTVKEGEKVETEFSPLNKIMNRTTQEISAAEPSK